MGSAAYVVGDQSVQPGHGHQQTDQAHRAHHFHRDFWRFHGLVPIVLLVRSGIDHRQVRIERADRFLHRLNQLNRVAARTHHQSQARDRMLSQRQIYKVRGKVGGVFILDGFGHADNLDQSSVAAIESDMLPDGILARPIVFRELLIHHRDAGRLRGIGLQKSAATQNRDGHGVEIPFVDCVHGRTEILAVARQLQAIGDEGQAVEMIGPERDVLHQGVALHSGSFTQAFGQQFVELPRLSWVVLHQARIESRHQQMILLEIGSDLQVALETAHHQECRGQQHQRGGNLRHHQDVSAPHPFSSRHVDFRGFNSARQVHARALQRRGQPAEHRAQHRQGETGQKHARVHAEW